MEATILALIILDNTPQLVLSKYNIPSLNFWNNAYIKKEITKVSIWISEYKKSQYIHHLILSEQDSLKDIHVYSKSAELNTVVLYTHNELSFSKIYDIFNDIFSKLPNLNSIPEIPTYEQYTTKVEQISEQINDVTNIMKDTIQKAISRGEKIETLVLKAEELESIASVFPKKAKELNSCCNIL